MYRGDLWKMPLAQVVQKRCRDGNAVLHDGTARSYKGELALEVRDGQDTQSSC